MLSYSLLEKDKKGEIKIEAGIEDIHSQIEKELTLLLGPAGKKIHTGRSRNDQVLTDIRLYTRELIDDLAVNTGRLFGKATVSQRTAQGSSYTGIYAHAACYGLIIRIMVRVVCGMPG